jgi:hypothetical protein
MPSCKTEVVTPASFRSTKINNRLALIIVIAPKQDQLTFHHILGFEPKLRGTALIGAQGPWTVTLPAFAEAEYRSLIGSL